MKVAIGTYEHTKALKDGSVSSPDLSLEFVEVSPITQAFRQMAMQQAYDISEMALVTYMLARVYDKPIIGLPIILVRSTLLPALVTSEDSPMHDARELTGQTLGVRSYTQTTGVWVRGILQDHFGVDLSSLRWVTSEGSHLDEFTDPPNVSRAPSGKSVAEMVKSGGLAAGVGIPPEPGLRPLMPDAAASEAEWARITDVTTVNHIVAVKKSLVDADPELPRKLMVLFNRARGQSAPVPPIGVEPNRDAFETLSRYAKEQGITPEQLSVDELFPHRA